MLEVRAQFHAVLAQATRNKWLARQAIQMHQDMIDALAAGERARYRKIVLQQIRGGLKTYRSRFR
jgi:DNA-binding GntR family transcriptional regulator